ncbi:MAG: type III pantothenate kinase, partial [Bacilli bacterium]|nr:type III pantothenate kinase [Bacilli bacterium]
ELENAKKALKTCKNIDDAMIFSVVPASNKIVKQIIKESCDIDASIFDWQSYELAKKNPNSTDSIGADLLADIKQAEIEYGGPCLVADFGTVTKLLYLNEKSNFEGLSLIPGLETTIEMFNSKTALLPKLEMSVPPKNRLGQNTIESMSHGTYWSTVYYVKEVLKSLKLDNSKLILTGGNLRFVKDEFKDAIVDKELTLKGMNVLFREIEK